jgi:hypothetical protein
MIGITDNLHQDHYAFLIISLSFPTKTRNVSEKMYKQSKRTFYVLFFFKIVPFSDNVEKYCTARQATDGNMAHAHCMLDNEG